MWCLGDIQGEDVAGSWICEQLHSTTYQQPEGAEHWAPPKPSPPAIFPKAISLMLRPKALESPLTFLTHPAHPVHQQNICISLQNISRISPELNSHYLPYGLSWLFPLLRTVHSQHSSWRDLSKIQGRSSLFCSEPCRVSPSCVK